jgi:hypothetical protein
MPKQADELLPAKLRGKYTKAQRTTHMRKIGRATDLALKQPAGIGKVAKPKHSLKAHDPHKQISKLEQDMGPQLEKKYPDTFRGYWPGQDEFLRTSFVTEFLAEVQKYNLKPAEIAQLKNIIEHFSILRFPTRWSGFNLKGTLEIYGYKAMQHSTSPGTGIWIPSVSGFSKPHTDLDDARVKLGIDTFLSFLRSDAHGNFKLKPGVTLEHVVKATLVAVGTFTLNYFTAPALAVNVEPDPSVSIKVRTAQTKAREYTKDRVVDMGATRVPSLDLSLTRPFRPDTVGPKQVSPRRGPPVTKAEAEGLWLIK